VDFSTILFHARDILIFPNLLAACPQGRVGCVQLRDKPGPSGPPLKRESTHHVAHRATVISRRIFRM
jgi:hypothetical protein